MGVICDALKAGERLPFDLLACHYDDTCEFWNWWWETKANCKELSRPYTIQDDDQILIPTISKVIVDTQSRQEFFSEFLIQPLRTGILPSSKTVSRQEFRETISEYLSKRGVATDVPSIVFVGGGYGSGKTTTLAALAKENLLPVPMSALLGVDYCKLHIPEFDLIRRVSDGRASTVCQGESRSISDLLFRRLIMERRSFGWDSSMANGAETIQKISAAKEAGFHITFVAVATPVEIAIERAMSRARKMRRFAHPDHLAESAREFASQFPKYVSLFDKVMLYYNGVNDSSGRAQPLLIAEGAKESVLASYDDKLLREFLTQGGSA